MHTQPETTVGLILSLASSLPPNAPLARRARRTASRLRHGASSCATADLLADLLNAVDVDLSDYAEDGVLDSAWDDL